MTRKRPVDPKHSSLLSHTITGVKLIAAFALGALTYFTALPESFRRHWILLGLGLSLVTAIYLLFTRERYWTTEIDGIRRASRAGLVDAWALRADYPDYGNRVVELAASSDHVDMLGFNLLRPFLGQHGIFVKMLREKLLRDGKFYMRVILPEPSSDGLKLRAEDEGSPAGRMQLECDSALKCLTELKGLPEIKAKLEVKLIDARLIRAGIFIADNTILVTHYHAKRHGGKSPMFEIQGVDSPLFLEYRAEFDDLWAIGDQYYPS